jgi:methanogenic corrinoid protein MtbC1
LEFVRRSQFELAQPEVLGLPSSVGTGPAIMDRASRLYRQAMEAGDQARCLQVALDARLQGQNMAAFGDRVIAPAFEELGQSWQHGKTAVYQERRGVEITHYVLVRLKDALGPPRSDAPTAVGATPRGDPYSLAGQLCELVLLELGWQARFLGSELPIATVSEAVADIRPDVLWLSVSSVEERAPFIRDCRHLYETCLEQHCAVVIGGRALTSEVRQEMEYTSYGDNLLHLRSFAQSLRWPKRGVADA